MTTSSQKVVASSMRTCSLSTDTPLSPRLEHGVQLLTAALERAGLAVVPSPAAADLEVVVGVRGRSEPVRRLEEDEVLLYNTGAPGEDGYYLSVLPGRVLVVTGGNETGVLYGCQELARVLDAGDGLPLDLDRGETPDMVLRGPAIGLQKTTVEPPRQVYEYPITPSRFPWFYDRAHWSELLDRLFEQRANVVYLWSGHPFSSLVRLPEFPEAQEVTDDELAANRDTLHWLTTEADRRGIWVVLKFYNIHIPLPFAEHHGIPLRQPRPTPLTSAYTRAAIGAFVAQYPNVGLYVCLGEVLQGDLYGTEWFCDTILPGVEDGIAAAGLTEPPPVILRGHAIDPEPVVAAARQRYPRLFTEAKYNGESLTTWNPRGAWQAQHRHLSALDSIHIVNVHILANLEPFRYGAVSFIQRSVQAMKHRLDANGLHLYPLFYWEWPYSPDRAEPRLRQLDRDWIWYEAWHRYAWKADRDPDAERRYWTSRLAGHFGSEEAGEAALDAYEAIGQVAPRLVRRIGITEGNRQTLSLGMTMSQLTNAARHRPWPDLWESHAPNGERLDRYVERELAGQPHLGETPTDLVDTVRHFAARAGEAVRRGLGHATRDVAGYQRLRDDVTALRLLTEFYALRVEAAIEIMLYRGEPEPSLARLHRAADLVEASVGHYRELTELTTRTYRYANSMQTPQRKVPFPDGSAFGHWRQSLPRYEAEAAHLRANLGYLDRGELPPALTTGGEEVGPFRPVEFTLASDGGAEVVELTPGVAAFTDVDAPVRRLAPELHGLRGVRLPKRVAAHQQVTVELTLPRPAHVLVGYFRDPDPVWAQVPDLETDTHADERGGLEPVLREAIAVEYQPKVDVHAFRHPAGTATVELGRGAYLVAGVVEADQRFTGRTASPDDDRTDTLDWLYEDPEGPR
ncbi:beta-N-acetylhexosaminidase family protein [Desertihabitans aurantiacus]|uniref:hypothetical protein n=1 Tax=Desertihabitans aurantiacus TaxID=2282477 RepID=UPI001E34D5ED|nr:hypothetical protein [Desertihabitans aurantiacus]